MPPARILIADDESDLCSVLQRWLRNEPWAVETAGDGREALARLCKHHFDVAVLDLLMPPPDGMEALKTIRQKGLQTDVVVLTGYGAVDTAVRAMKMGAQDFLKKPVGKREFVETLRALVERRHPPPHVLADRLDAFLRDHICDSTLKLSSLCVHFRISRRYVCRLFRDHIGVPFRERLRHWRIQEAKRLLASTDLSVYLIAERCGFRNHRRLAEAFRRIEGTSPRAYRKICAHKRTKCT